MQYNLVAVSNKQAVNSWTKLKFETVCKIPKDFKPPEKDYVDALVYKGSEFSNVLFIFAAIL